MMKQTNHNTLIYTRFVVLLILAILSWSCSKQKNTGVETTNGIQVSVQLSDGRPASAARVLVINNQNWKDLIESGISVVRDSLLADEKGIVFLDSFPAGLTLEAYCNGEALLQSTTEMHIDTPIQLMPQSQISGIAPLGVQEVLLAGTSLRTPVAANGTFLFAQVPPGNYTLFVNTAGSVVPAQSVSAPSGVQVPVTLPASSAERLVLDNFDDGDGFHLFATEVQGGTWFWTSDSTSSLSPLPNESQNSLFALALTDSAAWNGKSLHVLAEIDNTKPGQFANLGVNLRQGSDALLSYINLCNLDTLVFMAKGSGEMLVQWTTPIFNENPDKPVMYSTLITLNTAWTRMAIPHDSILPMDGRNVSAGVTAWSEACFQVRNLTFTFDGPAEFWLDDVLLVGSNLGNALLHLE